MSMAICLGMGLPFLGAGAEDTSPSGVVTRLFIILLLIFLNGFFVASEFALVKVRSSQLDLLEEEGNRRASLANHVISNLDAYLSATQLGITLASLALGWIGQPYVASLLAPALYHIGISSKAVVDGISITVGFALITYFHIVLAELTPKTVSLRKPLETSLWVSSPPHLFYLTSRPATSSFQCPLL